MIYLLLLKLDAARGQITCGFYVRKARLLFCSGSVRVRLVSDPLRTVLCLITTSHPKWQRINCLFITDLLPRKIQSNNSHTRCELRELHTYWLYDDENGTEALFNRLMSKKIAFCLKLNFLRNFPISSIFNLTHNYKFPYKSVHFASLVPVSSCFLDPDRMTLASK